MQSIGVWLLVLSIALALLALIAALRNAGRRRLHTSTSNLPLQSWDVEPPPASWLWWWGAHNSDSAQHDDTLSAFDDHGGGDWGGGDLGGGGDGGGGSD